MSSTELSPQYITPTQSVLLPRRKKRRIELAYEEAEAAGIVQLCEDEAGPYQAIPQAGASWQAEGHPAVQPHEYERGRTAKLLRAQCRQTTAPCGWMSKAPS